MTDIVEPTVSRPYVEILIPGPQGAPGSSGGEFLVHTGSAYPARSSVDNPVVFVGPVDPGVLLLDGDAWVDTGGDAPVTSVNGEIGDVVLSAADVDALPDTYIPDYEDLTNAPDFQTQINNKLDTVTAPELIRDTMGTAIVAGTNMTVTVNDTSNTITLASSGSGGGGAVDSVNGQTGVVVLSAGDVTAVPTSRTVNGLALTANITLAKSNIGLGSVDNTADSAKAVLSATRLATARNINGVSFDGTANITIPVTSSFLVSGTVPGDLEVQDLIAGGVRMPAAATIDKILLQLDIEPRGTTSTQVQVIKRARLTGTDTTLGTATFTAGSKRAVLSTLATSVVAGDSIVLRCTQRGEAATGTDLSYIISDAAASTFPAALTAPAAPTGFTAVASGADVVLAWTASASGVHYATDIWKDGTFLNRITKGTTSYLDVSGGDEDHTYTLYAANTDVTSTGVNATFTQTSGIGTPVFLGGGIANTSGTTVTMNSTVAVAAGDTIVVCLAGSVPTGLSEVWSIADSRGNTYLNHVHAYDNTMSQQSMIASSRLTTNVQAGDTITVTGTNATARLAIHAYSVGGIAASSRLDKVQSNTPSTSTRNMTTNATAALVQANEIAFATFSAQANAAPVVNGTGWMSGQITATTAASNDKMVFTMWRITNSTSAVTGLATLNTSSNYSGAIATLKG